MEFRLLVLDWEKDRECGAGKAESKTHNTLEGVGYCL